MPINAKPAAVVRGGLREIDAAEQHVGVSPSPNAQRPQAIRATLHGSDHAEALGISVRTVSGVGAAGQAAPE